MQSYFHKRLEELQNNNNNQNQIKMKKGLGIAVFIQFAIMALVITGEVKCIYKAIKCNWEPIGKAEVIYTGAALTGLGVFVGWMDIKDK